MKKVKAQAGSAAARAAKISAKSHLYLAEDFRPEQGGMVTAVGLYPEEIVVLVPPPQAPSGEQVPALIDKLSVLVTVRCDDGKYPVAIFFVDKPDSAPDVQHPMAQQDIEFSETNRVVNFAFKFVPFPVEAPGDRHVIVKVGDFFEHVHTFSIVKQPKPAVAAA